MTTPDMPDDTRPSRADADDVADAMIGVDTRILTTIWDTLIHTPRVLQAAFEGDRSRHVPILRLFLVLFGLQFAVIAFVGVPQALTLDQFITEQDAAVLDSWLDGLDEAAVNQTLERAASVTNTIIIFIASLPYLLLLKLYRPQRSFFGHLLAYLLATNASYLIMLPLILPGAASDFMTWYLISVVVGLLVYFIALGRILYAHYTRKAWLLTVQMLGMILLLPITFLLVGLAQFGVAELVTQAFHDRSFLELLTLAAETPPT